MKRSRGINLSEWALNHRTLMLFFCVVLALTGIASYFKLGQAEDPAFTFRVMVVNVQWPGASAREIEQQVTDQIEKKLQETPSLDYLRSFVRPGEAYIFVSLKESTDPKSVASIWYEVRKKVGDMRAYLPAGVQGPYFNDEFGDTFGSIYAFTAEGFTPAELRDYVDAARQRLLKVADVSKVNVLGVQEERIFVEFSSAKMATLGLDPQLIAASLSSQNAVVPTGAIETPKDRIYVRLSGALKNETDIQNLVIRANNRSFRLGDIATVKRDYADPPAVRFRFNGKPALALAVSMQKGGNIMALGKRLDKEMAEIKADLPVGIEAVQVSDQPKVVKSAVAEFMETLLLAVVIVLAVSFLSLGLRTGTVVALSIPLVLAIVFMGMYLLDIDLQKISLGALIIALGLLVDDAIISVEMMALKLEQGWDKFKAGTFAYTSTAFPMLTGTLITAAGFLPVGLAKSMAGEYVQSMFVVVSLALLVSWVVAVMFVPYLGFSILKADPHHEERDVYKTGFYRTFRTMVTWCVSHRWITIGVTVAMFVLSIAGFGLVQQQFFPHSTRPEIVVDLWLPEGSSPAATQAVTERFERALKGDKNIENISSYIGGGAPRFVLVLDEQMPAANLAELVVLTRGTEEREVTLKKIQKILETEFPELRGYASRMPNGPPVGYPVQFRVSGPDAAITLKYAEQVAAIMRKNPNTRDVNLDWGYKARAARLEIDQDKARALGLSSAQLSETLHLLLTGTTITQVRDGDRQVNVVLRADAKDRDTLGQLENINLPLGNGRFVPLAQVAHITYEPEDGIIWRWNRYPTITARADIPDNMQAPTVTFQIDPELNSLRQSLLPGYSIELGGAQEASAKSQDSINAVMPLMLIVVISLLMLQLQSFSRVILVLLTAPLGIIGVTIFLVIFDMPFGFVAMLGVIALAGMIMRNSVILVDQIEQDTRRGLDPWHAVIESTVRRFRPIVLTALAAILGMIPLTRSVFWGPMAVAIMGGLLVATILTLLFLPALYAAWFRIRLPKELSV